MRSFRTAFGFYVQRHKSPKIVAISTTKKDAIIALNIYARYLKAFGMFTSDLCLSTRIVEVQPPMISENAETLNQCISIILLLVGIGKVVSLAWSKAKTIALCNID